MPNETFFDIRYNQYRGNSVSKNTPLCGRKRWTMDIASVAMAMTHASSLSKIGTAMLDQAMETNQTLGQGLVEMIDSAAMERSVYPHIGSNFDMVV